MTSIIVYLNISGLGLTTAASVLIAKNNDFADKLLIAKRVLVLLVTSVTVFLAIFLFLDRISNKWIDIIGFIPDNLRTEVHKAFFWMIVLYSIHQILSLSYAILNGFQKLYVDKNFTILETTLVFGSTLLTVWLNGNLISLVIATGLTRIIINLGKCIFIYFVIYKNLNTIELYKRGNNLDASYKNIISTGIRFLSIGLAAMVVWNTDNLVISHFMGFKDVTSYSTTFKFYGLLFSLISIINSALWPIMGKEIGQQNWEWINRTYHNLFHLQICLGGCLWLCGILFMKDFILFWVGPDGYAGMGVLFFFGGYTYLLSSVTLHSGIISTFNFIKKMAYIGWWEAVANFCFSIVLLQYFGLFGVAMGTFIGSLIGPFIILPHIIKKRTNGKITTKLSFIINHFLLAIVPLLILSLIIGIYIDHIFFKILISEISIIFCFNIRSMLIFINICFTTN